MMNKQKTYNFRKIHAEEPSFESKSKMKEKEEKIKKKSGLPKQINARDQDRNERLGKKTVTPRTLLSKNKSKKLKKMNPRSPLGSKSRSRSKNVRLKDVDITYETVDHENENVEGPFERQRDTASKKSKSPRKMSSKSNRKDASLENENNQY